MDSPSKPSQRFSKKNAREENKNGSSSRESLHLKGNNTNTYVLKRKSAKSNTSDITKSATMDTQKHTYSLRNGRKREKVRLADRKHSHIYIEKNLSYSPSMVKGVGKNSHTPSLLIRNNLKNIDKVSPYNHNSKTRNLYNGNYSISGSNFPFRNIGRKEPGILDGSIIKTTKNHSSGMFLSTQYSGS